MGVSKSFHNFTEGLNRCLRRTLVSYGERRALWEKKHLVNKVCLTKEQQAEIQSFYKKHYGKKISLSWHRMYQSYTGIYRKDYFPEILFSSRLEPKTNPYQIAEFLDDKNWIPILFSGIEGLRLPKTYGASVRGTYYIGDQKVVAKDTFFEDLKNVGKCVVKKTVDTSSGRDVEICDIKNGVDTISNKKLEEITKKFGANFVIQEFVIQSSAVARLNSSSFNTFRLVSYICDGEIYTSAVVLRLGRNNATKDNIHHGGIGVCVNPDGTLRGHAYSGNGEAYTEHPDSHVHFEGYSVLPDGTRILTDMARKLHSRVLHLKVLSWDLGIDENGSVVLIEMNASGQSSGICQRVTGESLFGENTPKMLAMIKKR